MTQKYDRFKSAPWFQEGVKPSVLIGGAGGIGSWLTILLNRAGFETYVYDFDKLEEINMAGQLFMHQSIGMTKVDALAEITRALCREEIIANFVKVDENTMTNEIVFAAFDNIKARKDMFTTWAQNYKGRKDAIFIDGRLTAEQLTIFSIRGDDEVGIEEYKTDHLPDDSVIPELQCTLRQTSHGAAMIAAHMIEMFTNWYSHVLGTDESRNVPFFWEYIIPIGYCSQRDAIKTTVDEPGWLSDSGTFVTLTPEQKETIDEVRNLVSLQESKKEAEPEEDWIRLPFNKSEITTAAASARGWARRNNYQVTEMEEWYCNGIFQFNAMLCTRTDDSQYLILDENGILMDWPLRKGETAELDLTPQEATEVYGFELNSNPFNLPSDELKDYYIIDNKPIHKDTPNIAQLIAESASVGTIQMMTLEEIKDKFGYVVGVDPYRLEETPPLIMGTAGEFDNNTEAQQVFNQQLPPIEEAQSELDRWAETQITNGPAPDLSILEDKNELDDLPS